MELHAKLMVPVNLGGRRWGALNKKWKNRHIPFAPKNPPFLGLQNGVQCKFRGAHIPGGQARFLVGKGHTLGFFHSKKPISFLRWQKTLLDDLPGGEDPPPKYNQNTKYWWAHTEILNLCDCNRFYLK